MASCTKVTVLAEDFDVSEEVIKWFAILLLSSIERMSFHRFIYCSLGKGFQLLENDFDVLLFVGRKVESIVDLPSVLSECVPKHRALILC